ncbi:hypothetical protein [Streptomyces sp. NPDC088752]|uniref:hypothetical protein n=1 Tax=Streptomyces sp. NPDC088752 TaxID=3154963 RepID=UPI00344AE0E4
MEYRSTVTHTDGTIDADPATYADKIVTNTLRAALAQGYNLDADADTGRLTLTCPGRNTIEIIPAAPLPKPTPAQRREIINLALTPGTYVYTRSNVPRIATGDRILHRQTVRALENGGYLGRLTGNGTPAALSLLAYLTIGRGGKDSAALAAMLRNVYSPRHAAA